MSYGKQDLNNDEENVSSAVNPDANNLGYDISVGYNVNLEVRYIYELDGNF